MTILEMSWWMLCVHAVTDGSLQTYFMATHKARWIRELDDTGCFDRKPRPYWLGSLSSHAIVCGAGVGWMTQIWWLGPLEALHHWITDYLSSNRYISFFWDQVSHLLAKAVWVWVWYALQ
jgi:hypothetical protein